MHIRSEKVSIMLLETKFSIAAANVKVQIINFASITCPHNGSHSCSSIPGIFYLIRKGSISLGTKISSGSPGSKSSMKQITPFVILLGTTIFLPTFQFESSIMSDGFLFSACVHVHMCLCVCVTANGEHMQGCEYFGEKRL